MEQDSQYGADASIGRAPFRASGSLSQVGQDNIMDWTTAMAAP